MIVCAVDHGNRLTKYPQGSFPSGIYDNGSMPPAGNGDCLEYEGRYYTIDESHRISFMMDKTKDSEQRYFLLTLIAVAKELEDNDSYIETATADNPFKIALAIGIPPGHYSFAKKRYEKYFRHGGAPISFRWNNKQYHIAVNRVFVYPQGYALRFSGDKAITDFMARYPEYYLIDIGGGTADYIYVIKDKTQWSSVGSEEQGGVNNLINHIRKDVRSRTGKMISEASVEAALRGEETGLSDDVMEMINSSAATNATRLLDRLAEQGVLLDMPCIFAGGGSMLFKDHLINSGRITGKYIFVDDVTANARGFENAALQVLLAESAAKKAKKKAVTIEEDDDE